MLCYGATIRSGIFSAGTMDTQKAIVVELLSNMKTKSYLPIITYIILTAKMNSVSDFYFSYAKVKNNNSGLIVIIFLLFCILVQWCYIFGNNLALFEEVHWIAYYKSNFRFFLLHITCVQSLSKINQWCIYFKSVGDWY